MQRHRSWCAVLLVALAACSRSSAPPEPSSDVPSEPVPDAPSGPVTPPTTPVSTSVAALRSLEPAPIQAACGTATIDGVISPDEWRDAVKVRFGALLPESVGGGTVAAEVMAMSDASNLYVAYRYATDTSVFAQSHIVELDANHSGSLDDGDDAWLLTWWPGAPGELLFFDDYRGPCLVDGVVQSCAPEDTDPDTGFGEPGTTDGGASIGFGVDETVVEMWHPYDGGDTRDVSASPGESVPLSFSIRLLDACNEWPRCFGDTYFPGVSEYRPFLLACGAPPPPAGSDEDEDVIEVRIDVKPGDALPTIQLGSDGVTTVAVVGSAAFDATLVDPASLWFAGAPVARDAAGAPWTSVADTNGDALPDLVANFETGALQLALGDTEASLAGLTVTGRRFHGTDAVRVAP